jgi:23S rRNA (cytidine1920-2'-O)/16S rRNA (cytidine1409-2'-O)-methyltransferase
MNARLRVDVLLVRRGLFESRAKAQAAIEAGLVRAGDRTVAKASEEIALDAAVHATPAHPWVSRGGVKLAGALDRLGIDVSGRTCLDVGSSTGGFTQVLLARGAARVYAVDGGRAQLHPTLRDRPEIVSIEQTDIRALDPALLAPPPDFVCVDVSFISLKAVLPAVCALATADAHLVVLIKPQFEVGRRLLKKGIVRDAALRQAVCDDIAAAASTLGWAVSTVFPSPIPGGDGNAEFFLGAARG